LHVGTDQWNSAILDQERGASWCDRAGLKEISARAGFARHAPKGAEFGGSRDVA
jgi:hypothetical protein